jgi:hypothetical protein
MFFVVYLANVSRAALLGALRPKMLVPIATRLTLTLYLVESLLLRWLVVFRLRTFGSPTALPAPYEVFDRRAGRRPLIFWRLGHRILLDDNRPRPGPNRTYISPRAATSTRTPRPPTSYTTRA